MHKLRDVLGKQTACRPRASTAKPPGRVHRNTREVQGAPSPRSTAYEALKAGLRLVIHDYSGHPGQVHFSLELTRRGRHVESYTTGRGATVTPSPLLCAPSS
jgi:hypothetical protein